ncbi:hypothetical protein M153_2200051783 [Pseudoloma neurophilia]|uniref:Uncharacterized protein n=1 Tax=Pseudoloma neurophilia TaxID=146866 RepID=A0A0R0M6H5_9MICR|nr:hypothetical protein M153_2200051783 [Pseudoloma neurophilia]
MQSRFKKLIRKVDRIEYLNTNLPNNYEEIQEDYRTVKKKLEILRTSFIKFMSYEHGGSAFKATMRAIEVVGRKISHDSYEMKSFYREAEIAIREITKIRSNDSLKNIAEKYSSALSSIEDSKIKMNDEMEKIIKIIKDLQEQIKEIDESRANILNLRYDLEKLYKKRGPEDPELAQQKTQFHSQVNITREQMTNFIKDDRVFSVLKDSAAVQAQFFEEAANQLKNVD